MRIMLSSLRRWLRLPPPERRQTARAALSLLRAKAFSRASSIQRAHLAALAADDTPPEEPATNRLLLARDYARAVDRAARGLPFSTSCLERSLALRRLLRGQGLATDLRIGVRRSPDGLTAHAWLELSGTVLNDSEDVHERYAAFSESVLPTRLELR